MQLLAGHGLLAQRSMSTKRCGAARRSAARASAERCRAYSVRRHSVSQTLTRARGWQKLHETPRGARQLPPSPSCVCARARARAHERDRTQRRLSHTLKCASVSRWLCVLVTLERERSHAVVFAERLAERCRDGVSSLTRLDAVRVNESSRERCHPLAKRVYCAGKCA